MTAKQDTRSQIVIDLANLRPLQIIGFHEMGPTRDDEAEPLYGCRFCGVASLAVEVGNHRPECVWARARLQVGAPLILPGETRPLTMTGYARSMECTIHEPPTATTTGDEDGE